MTPRSPGVERLPRLSRRALVLGGCGVLAGAVAMAVLGFTAAGPAPAIATRPSPSSSAGQLTTLSLNELRAHLPLGRR